MADFPDKVNTQTSTGSNARGNFPIGIDTYFLKSFFGILMIVELVFGLLVWALISGSRISAGDEAFGWVIFVAIFLWIFTIILFLFYLLNLTSKLPKVPWDQLRLYFNLAATILYLTAFITNASSIDPTSIRGTYKYNNRAASAFFAGVVMIAYGLSTLLALLSLRGGRDNAATSQATGHNSA
ncbi:plasmolipin [Amblyraja radiata]|uniref:plasmolipin n=1 Tax=Amblyraja radiata TaxID=386614 RepID=UPI001402171D|nr:plasmolipin [Amblyraja radiata]XP_032892092.1 plasmolipin [Amblyraja radiata]XP_032892093.1 plasmolipin [Amblyraja radiata]